MSVGALVAVILLAPLVAVFGSLAFRRPRPSEYLNLAAAIVSFGAVVALLPRALAGPYTLLRGYVIVDPLGCWVLLSVATVYLLASIYSIGYMRGLGLDARLHRYYALFAGFALTTLLGPLMNNIGVYWIAIELTTLVSTFLVGFEHTRESVEAAWKYIIVVSAGISLALLGIIFFYWAGSLTLGPTYDLTWSALRAVAPSSTPPSPSQHSCSFSSASERRWVSHRCIPGSRTLTARVPRQSPPCSPGPSSTRRWSGLHGSSRWPTPHS